MSKKSPADKWFDIYYGLVSKQTHISRRNLIEMEYHGILPMECYLDGTIIDKISKIYNPVLK